MFYAKTSGYYFGDVKEKAYTKAKGRKAGVVNYGAGSAEFFQDTEGVYNWVNCRDVWDIPYINSQAKERTGYPTQKPVALLERVIRASSKEGDVVLDPFCGSGTTCVVAQQLGRQWIGIDIEAKAADILAERLGGESGSGDRFALNLFRLGKRYAGQALAIKPRPALRRRGGRAGDRTKWLATK